MKEEEQDAYRLYFWMERRGLSWRLAVDTGVAPSGKCTCILMTFSLRVCFFQITSKSNTRQEMKRSVQQKSGVY